MRNPIRFCTIALTAVLLSTTIFSAGCGCLRQACQPYGPRVTGDGTGGAIAVYEDIKGGNQHDFYVQKISPEGEALWAEKGVLIGSAYKECDSFHELHIVSDSSGGAFITWGGYPSEPDWRLAPGQRQIEYLTHVTKVDSEGSVTWQREVRGVDHMISDGAGGVIIATDYSYDEGTLFIIKIDSDGNFPWAEEGVSIRCEGYTDHTLGLVSDGNGGAIIIWQERKGEPGERVSQIFAQKIDIEGSLPWGQNGILLYTTPEGVFSEEPKVISDGSGGAIAVWMQVPEGRIEEGSPKALLNDIYAQRVDTGGNVLWTPNGVPLNAYEGGGFPHNLLVVSDDAGGAIIFLWGGCAQKIGAGGNTEWQPGGMEVITSSLPSNAIRDGSGGVIVTFGHKESGSKKSVLYVQKIDATGVTVWPGTGIPVTEQGTHDIAYDGQGGAIIAWGSGKSMFSSEKSYVQRVSAGGKLLWGEKGIRLTP
jgi:hypothetical protein